MIDNQTANYTAKVYVYDLDNCAKEFGFKQDENWELSVLSDSDKIAIEKRYYPTVSIKALPEMLPVLFNLVRTRLAQLTGITNKGNPAQMSAADLQFLVAYNPKRPRT
ncbi:hypothetical protein HDF24_18695 [Mucilaginibacter sp. X4EP1]|jgi:hypothetical protein|uniref:hypothetical protein n=1 Tax=Mucilaginibacter sp. X4EP1 TaxID=2723092 RepID=UPI00216A1B8E|nr:hypothetical protein [Mucilaginibacter sp. X4EP1]MCS3813398.1 hypothetical protein [Mucilaginibacter sp. X4EP1]